MKYDFIAYHHQEYPVTTMCQVLEVSVSGYYAWKQRPVSARQIADERLSARIHEVHEATHQVYGSRRMRAELAEQGNSCGRKRVVRLMRKLGLKARQRRHRTVTTDSQHRDPVAPNTRRIGILARLPPNAKWVTDMTGVWTAEGWLYVAIVLDLFSRMPRRLGHVCSSRYRSSRASPADGSAASASSSGSAASFRSRQPV